MGFTTSTTLLRSFVFFFCWLSLSFRSAVVTAFTTTRTTTTRTTTTTTTPVSLRHPKTKPCHGSNHQTMTLNLLRTGRFVTATAHRVTRPFPSCRYYCGTMPGETTTILTTETAGSARGRRLQQRRQRLSSTATATIPPPPPSSSFILGRRCYYSALRSSRQDTSAEDNQDTHTESEVESVSSSSSPSSTPSSSSSSSSSSLPTPSFRPGQKIQVEVMSFGPMGASVDIVADTHDPDHVIDEDTPPLGRGLILQKEIAYFRQGRDNVDVVRGEILPAYVERTREGGRVDIALRAFGGKAKAQDLGQSILQALQRVDGGGINNVSNGAIPVGDKSSPEEINAVFPGTSKSAFKKAVAMLYKEGKVQPGPYSIRLM